MFEGFLHLQPLVLLLLQILFYELFTLITDNHLAAACCLFKVLTVLRSSGVRRDCSGPDLQVGGRTNCWCNITVASGATLPLWPRWGLNTPDRVGFHNADEHELTSSSFWLQNQFFLNLNDLKWFDVFVQTFKPEKCFILTDRRMETLPDLNGEEFYL